MAAIAQTGTTAQVSGTITDPSGAAVAIASVELTNTATGAVLKQSVNSSGEYVFPNVPPGAYTLRVTAQGFRTATAANLQFDVTKTYTEDIKLEVGQLTETVEVTSLARAELQMVDATVGTVIPGKSLPAMPLFTRQVNELLTAQPGSTPTGEVTGARSDQSTFTLDGIDVTNNSVGGTGTFLYLGVEGVDEFRANVSNANASFGRASGGQVALIGKRGGSDYHGSLFWYHQNDNLNANNWNNNRIGIRKPEIKDNRFGFTAGGPIIKGKTFIFANYDGRRFPQATTITRNVPTDTMRQGILRFRDAAGNINSYDLKTSQACSASGTAACDPRGLGLSPTIASEFALLPAGNNPSAAGVDGLNTTGFTSVVTNPVNFGFYNARIDHHLSNNWNLDGEIRYFRQVAFSAAALDIRNGVVQSISKTPTRQNNESIGLNGILRPNLTAEFRFGRVRNRTVIDVQRPNVSASLLNLAATNTSAGAIAVDIGGRGGAQSILSEPFDNDTQLARRQENDNRIYQFNADLNWLKGKHTVQFGFHFRNLPTLHRRDDKVVGSLGSLLAQVDSDLGTLLLTPSTQPAPCTGGRTTGCLLTQDAQNWNRLYAGVTGLMDNISVLAVRDGSFKPLPFGSLLESDTHGIRAPEFYLTDTFRIRPGLTLSVGLNYGWQTAPTERLGRFTIEIDKNSGRLITTDDFFPAYRSAAAAGQFFNSAPFAFVPINDAHRDVFNVDYGTIAPRASLAWNPRGFGGFLGKALGERKTVIRAGYGLFYDRQNTVQSVIIPSLGIGFAQTINVTNPLCNATGAGGSKCTPGSTDPALNNFRIGFDGSIPLPVVPAQSNPASPPWGLIGGKVVLFPEILSFQVDPNMKVGRNQGVDVTIQRELPGNLIFEAGFVGRYASRLPQSMNLTQAPYTQVDKASGQTFATAFDAVANAYRAGGTPTAQPFFENQVPGGTAALASQRTNFINGNVSSIFQTVDTLRIQNGLTPFNNYMAQMGMLRASTGISNYTGLIITLRHPLTKGWYYDLGYTYSKSLDQIGNVQNGANVLPNSFDLYAEYGPSGFDIRHIVNFLTTYDLPFKAHRAVLKQLVNGWTVSGIFTARSGDPLTVTEGTQVWGGGLNLVGASPAIPTVDRATLETNVNFGVAGSNGIATTGNPASKGTGLNLFANPSAIYSDFRRVNIGSDTRSGRGNPLRGLPRWNIDTSVAKVTAITERIKFRFAFDFFNILNKVDFANPGLSLTSPTSFGVINNQLVPANRTDGARWIQVSARIDF